MRRYPPIQKIQLDPMRVNTSKDADIAALSSQTRSPELEGKVTGTIEKKLIPIDFSTFRDVGYTIAKAGVKPAQTPLMFGVVVEGTLTINNTTLDKFDWYVVPSGVEYGITSNTWYALIFAYVWSC
jgi:hypothetical protein